LSYSAVCTVFYDLNIHFKIIFSSTLRYFKWSLPLSECELKKVMGEIPELHGFEKKAKKIVNI
jgi:hypothetical protein